MKGIKEYLGDGAYVNFDGFHIVLTAENGIHATDTVYLDPFVLDNLLLYVERLKKAKAEKLKELSTDEK